MTDQSPAPGRGNRDTLLLLLVTAVALAVRLPCWETVPAVGDEINQAIYALRITQGHGYPLIGNDAYAGPVFFYLLALLFRLGVSDPMAGRAVVLIAGTLTVPLTYAWVRRLGANRVASLIAAALVTTNPHLILLNSHKGGTTYLLPFFTTLSLWALSEAVASDRPGWLIASAVSAGLAIQSNPVAALAVAGSWIWVAVRVRYSPQLGRHWPLWPLLAGLCVLLVYSPVIVYNLQFGLDSLDVLQERSYLWEASPTLLTVLNNERRLALQLVRQTGGVLAGDETLRMLVGVPLLYLAWMSAGLVFTTRRISALPICVIAPALFLLPYFSSHYGTVAPVRFTSLLTPAFSVGMGCLAAAGLERAGGACQSTVSWKIGLILIPVALLVVYPLLPLSRYYEEGRAKGRVLLDLCREMVAGNQGEPVYISGTSRSPYRNSIPYLPQTYLIFAGIYQEVLPVQQIIGRLFERPGRAALLVDDRDAATIREVASITPWPSAANRDSLELGYGLYILDADVPLTKPAFVLSAGELPDSVPGVPVGVPLGSGLELVGYDPPDIVAAGEALELVLYWRSTGSVAPGTYVGFVHLYDPAAASIVAQDDHILGRQQYPATVWELDEVVADHAVLQLPPDVAPGWYPLQVGVYTWPDLVRLQVAGHPNDVIELEPTSVAQ